MRRNVARAGRLSLAAALAYLIVGIVWETAFELSLTGAATPEFGPWEGLVSFLAWFVLPSALWPWTMSELVPGGPVIAIGLLALMTALMYGALTRLAPDVTAPAGARRPPRRRSPPQAPVGRPRTS